MKKILTAILLLLTSNLLAQDSGDFYVIPFPSDEIVEKEVCNGTPVGNVVFTIDVPTSQGYVIEGDVYSTTTGHLIEITGGRVILDGELNFRKAPKTLPSPGNGVKGPYYILWAGEIAFARFL